MERLTMRGRYGTAFFVRDEVPLPLEMMAKTEFSDSVVYNKYDMGPYISKLAAYEDTGLTPEELDQLCRDMSYVRQKMGCKTMQELLAKVDGDYDAE